LRIDFEEVFGLASEKTRELRHQVKQLEALNLIQRNLSVALNAENDLSSLWELVFDAVVQIESIDGGCVHLIDHENQVMTLVATRNFSQKFITYIDSYDFDSEQANIAFAKEPVYQPRSSFPILLQENLKTMGLECLVAIPVVHRNEVTAVLHLASFSEVQLPPWVRFFLENLTAQIGGAMARIRSSNQLADNNAALQKSSRELALGEEKF